MKWTVRSLVALTLLWAVYYASPYAALYQFGRALSERDSAALAERLDIDEVRKSVSRQLVTAYLKASGREAELGRSSGQLTVQVGAWMADPIVAEYVTAERIFGMLNGAPGAVPAGAAGPGGLGQIGFASLRDAWDLFLATERRGFTKVVFNLPLRQPPEARFGLLFRISDFAWKLSAVELPAELERRIVQEIMKKPLGT
jgi:hypothetical protein